MGCTSSSPTTKVQKKGCGHRLHTLNTVQTVQGRPRFNARMCRLSKEPCVKGAMCQKHSIVNSADLDATETLGSMSDTSSNGSRLSGTASTKFRSKRPTPLSSDSENGMSDEAESEATVNSSVFLPPPSPSDAKHIRRLAF